MYLCCWFLSEGIAFDDVRAEPGVDVVDVGIDVLADDLTAVVDGLFLDIEQNTHIRVGSADDSKDSKLHIRFGQCRIVFAQVAD